MNLNTLKPALGEKSGKKRVGQRYGLRHLEKHVAEAIMDKVLALVVLQKLDLRVVRCHYKEDCLKLVLLHVSQE